MNGPGFFELIESLGARFLNVITSISADECSGMIKVFSKVNRPG